MYIKKKVTNELNDDDIPFMKCPYELFDCVNCTSDRTHKCKALVPHERCEVCPFYKNSSEHDRIKKITAYNKFYLHYKQCKQIIKDNDLDLIISLKLDK